MDLPMYPSAYSMPPWPASDPPQPQSSFDRWEAIGGGETGTVHRLSENTVVKFPRIDSGDNQQALQWEKEVYTALGPNQRLLKLEGTLGSGLLFQYHPKGTVREVLCRSKNDLKLSEILKWCIQITEGLVHVHTMNVVQADVSLSNVLVTKDRNVVLCDFASASIQGDRIIQNTYEIRSCRLTARDTYEIDDDLFALGSLIYEMEAGLVPYHDKEDGDVKKLYAMGQFPLTTGMQLSKIIEKCWHSDYRNASEVLDDLLLLEAEHFKPNYGAKIRNFFKPMYDTIRKKVGKHKEEEWMGSSAHVSGALARNERFL